ncbi:hypothetical protein Mnod_7015 [Methylobacterium nodulans ORS 2060]|uniref:Uncharacterized protein n=1 Tax=Methylobacterium nodulans (strain LMG 21967 / CNCM I-2342 / ORS 2060) TaxID=460265 RepID=B8IIW1_METNO|nr:hypothetical protein Mnod_7015 [Methylobacterium nodulans ORS 2060]
MLFWIMVAQNGAVTSGSAEFETFEACRAASTYIGLAAAQASESASTRGTRGPVMTRQTQCFDKKTGKPAWP